MNSEQTGHRRGSGHRAAAGFADGGAGGPGFDAPAYTGAVLAALPGTALLTDATGDIIAESRDARGPDGASFRSPSAEAAVLRSGTPMAERGLAAERGWVDVLRVPVNLPGGRAAVLTLVTDATERKRLEAATTALAKRFDALIDAAPMGIAVLDLDGRVSSWNAEAERVFGWRAAEVVGRRMPVFDGDAQSRLVAKARGEAGEDTARFEARGMRRDGGSLETGVLAMPVPHTDGTAGATIVLLEDIGERRRAEEQLRLRDRAIASASNAVLIIDAALPGWPIVSVNAAFERITGYTAADVIGRDSRFLLDANAHDPATQQLLAEIRAGRGHNTTLLNYRKNGEPYWAEITMSPVTGSTGELTHFVAVLQDVTERRHAEETLEHLAFYDPVTDLPNRSLLRQRIQKAIVQGREAGEPTGLLVVDLHGFRELENLGPGIGDFALQVVGSRLLGAFDEETTVARLRGDQFAILIPAGEEEPVSAARRVVEVLEQPVGIEEMVLHIEGSVGIAVHPQHAQDAPTLLRCAEVAARQAEGSATSYAIYSAAGDRRRGDVLGLLGELRAAIDNGELLLHYQPSVEAATGRPIRVEALVRWDHPKRGLVMPGQFVVAAEQSTLIRPLTLWVAKAALAQVRAWLDEGIEVGVAVNLSARNLHDQKLVGNIAGLLDLYRVPPHLLTLEITESALMADLARGTEALRRLKELGCEISVDDFGTGYSSFAYLRGDLIDEVKIDQSFVAGMAKNQNDAAIVRSVIRLGHDLGLRVVAEGAETAAQLAMLRELGCDQIQGYYISRPGPASDIGILLRRGLAEGAA